MRRLGSDVRDAVRMLVRSPRSSLAVALTLAIGIAATTTVYAVFNHLLFRPMPGIAAPDELVTVTFQPADAPRTWAYGAIEAVTAFQSADVGLSSIAMWSGGPEPTPITLTASGDARLLGVEFAAQGYLETLGVRPRIGRLFHPDETREPGHAVALISEALWRREFRSSPDALGTSIVVAGRVVTIVGVLDDYRGWGTTAWNTGDIWLPEPGDPSQSPTVSLLVGRAKPGTTAASLQQALRGIYEPIRANQTARDAEYVPWVYEGLRLGVHPRGQGLPSFGVVLTIAALLLALACANAGNLLLASLASRRQDIAVRAAIGASRRDVARGLIVETGALAAVAVTLGLTLTWLLLRAIDGTRPFQSSALLEHVALDWRVLCVAAGAGVATILACAFAPIVSAARVDLRAVLQDAARTSTARRRLSRVLVSVQVTVAVALVAAAGIVVRSHANLRGVDLGVDRDVFSFRFQPRMAGARGAAARQALESVVARLRAVPGVVQVGTANPSLLDAAVTLQGTIRDEAESPDSSTRMQTTVVSSEFFEAAGIALRAGRPFARAETAAGPNDVRNVLLSEALAKEMFGSGPAVGRRVTIGPSSRSGVWQRRYVGEVVGVTADVATAASLRDQTAAHVVYEAVEPMMSDTRVLVRSALAPGEMERQVRTVLSNLDARYVPLTPGTIGDEADRLMPEARSLAWLLATVAIVATLLGCSGVYALVAQSVSQRTREFGVRLALGAGAASILRSAGAGLVLPLAIGALAGGAVYAVGSRILASRLFGLTPLDPGTISAAVSGLALLTLVAAWVPARRATRVDPVQALRP